MKILAGDWSTDLKVKLVENGGRMQQLRLGSFGFMVIIKPEDIESVTEITAENHNSVLGKLGWGTVGAVAMGPLGLLAGAVFGGQRQSKVIAMTFTSGKKIMLQVKPKEAAVLLAAKFAQSMGTVKSSKTNEIPPF